MIRRNVTLTMTLVRHGETMSNRENIIQGQLDTKLSDLGQTQAELVGKRLRDYHFTHMYTSDLSRAADTARAIVAANQKTTCDLIMHKKLRERSFGWLQGKPFSEFQRDAEEKNVPPSEYVPDGGETLDQVTQRAREFLHELCKSLMFHECQDSVDKKSSSIDESTAGSSTSSGIENKSISSKKSQGAEKNVADSSQETNKKTVRPGSSRQQEHGNTFEDHEEKLNVLIVSHGLWLKMFRKVIMSHYKGEELEGDLKTEVSRISPNTGVSQFRLLISPSEHKTKIHIRCSEILLVNDASHLIVDGKDLVSYAKFQGAF